MTRKVVEKNGTVRYYNDKNYFHREDGPAIECGNGTKEWWINGKRHREDGPAVELSNGDKEWYQNDKRHREDGPAVEWNNGTKEWWFDGQKYSQKQFQKLPQIKFIIQQLKEFDDIQKQGI